MNKKGLALRIRNPMSSDINPKKNKIIINSILLQIGDENVYFSLK